MDFRQFSANDGSGNKTVCPSDRQLALRAKLRTGWSTNRLQEPLRPEEKAAILSVVQRNEELEMAERQRVGRLVERLEKIRLHASIDRGPNNCRLCGDAFGLWRYHRVICEDCQKTVCPKCCLDVNLRRRYASLPVNGEQSQSKINRELWLCRVCSETREMLKKTGAWFYKGLPNYKDLEHSPTNHSGNTNIDKETKTTIQKDLVDHATEKLEIKDFAKKKEGTNKVAKKQKTRKLSIHVSDSSSSSNVSSESSEEDGSEDISIKLRNNKCINSNFFTINKKVNAAQEILAKELNYSDHQQDGNTNNLWSSDQQNNDMSDEKSSQKNSICLNKFSSSRSLLDNGKKTSRTLNLSNQKKDFNESMEKVIESSNVKDNQTAENYKLVTNTPNVGSYRDPLLGWLELTLIYRETENTLDVSIVRARDLPATDAMGLTDAYCKLNIINGEDQIKYSRWRQTRTVRKNRHPEFAETVQFGGMRSEELSNDILYVAVHDEDKYGHDFLGAAKIYLFTIQGANQYRMFVPLSIVDDELHASQSLSATPTFISDNHCPFGRIFLGLCYNSRKRALMVKIKQCSELKAMDSNGTSDPFIKLQMKPDSHRNKKCKTHVKWRTLNPIFNEEFQFESSPHDLNKQALILTVWDKDIGKSNDFLGSLVIGYNSKGERLQQWMDCIRLPDQYHEKWHCLAGDNVLGN